MVLAAPRDRSRCRPFRILNGRSESGPRIGGRAPERVGDMILRADAAYVLTVPLATEPDLDLSVFVQGELWGAMNGGLFSDDRIIAVTHAPSPRRSDRRFASELSEHCIILSDEALDLKAETRSGRTMPRGDHKLGGRPHCVQEPELEGAEALLDRGFVQLLQVGFPNGADAIVSGSWPFADGMFNLFGVAPFSTVFWAFQK